jgi:kinesin family protein 5
MNAVSSRSHSLFILSVHQKAPDGSTKQGKLNLADLAGSEKIGKTGATGETLEEAKKINQSLSALGNCISALTKSKKAHVPYRDSKLTHILRESLGGNCKTTLLIACSPHRFNMEETITTLKFGQRAKAIKNPVTQNKQRSVEELNRIIDKLTAELNVLKKYVAAVEKELETSKGPEWSLADFKKKCQATPVVTIVEDKEDVEEKSEDLSEPSTPRASTDSSIPESPGPMSPGFLSPPVTPGSDMIRTASGDLRDIERAVELEQYKEATALQIEELNDEIKSVSLMDV